MTSKPRSGYVWIWLPGQPEPVVAGQLAARNETLVFNYGKSYLARGDAISIYAPELPLQSGAIPLFNSLVMPGCIRDASPDAWGRRVLINRLLGKKGRDIETEALSELTYLLESGSDRIGALDFQESSSEYVPRSPGNATLEELLTSAEKVENGIPLTPDLDDALFHASSIGGARPKALIESEGRKYIAKFSSNNDVRSIVKAEFVAMRLAGLCGIEVAPVELAYASGKEVLLTERFDRVKTEAGWQRRAIVSALTLLRLDEMMARYASYEDFAVLIRHHFSDTATSLEELFSRLVFNILCGNTDDHARNHAAFWDGVSLALTPAYDLCPQGRTGNIASQAMRIWGEQRQSRISSCLRVADQFLLSPSQVREIVERQLMTIAEHWEEVCIDAELTSVDRALLAGRQFLNPYVFEDLEVGETSIKSLAVEVKASLTGAS